MVSMFLLILMVSISFSLVLFILGFSLSEKMYFSKMKSMEFECGIENFQPTRMELSLNFFVICLIFIVFDLEILILFNLLFLNFGLMKLLAAVYFVLGFIFTTLMLEWKMDAVKWKF